jgi:threonine dehydrogenase-like Zn-dependent dehydrogenase
MRPLVCTKPEQFEYAAGEKPELRKGQAIIRIKRIGICGTDLQAIEGNNHSLNTRGYRDMS